MGDRCSHFVKSKTVSPKWHRADRQRERDRQRLLRGQVFVQGAVRFKGNLCDCSQLRVSTAGGRSKINSTWSLITEGGTLSFQIFVLFLSLLIGWQLPIWTCYKPFFSLLYNCQVLCPWRLASSTVVEVFPRPYFQILLLQGCSLQTRCA